MITTSLVLDGRSRQWLVDLTIGLASALVAITVAKAALPEAPDGLTAHPLRRAAAVVAPPQAPRPVYLIAFGQPVPGREVISPFGLRKLPWEEGGRLHQGVDIAGDNGEAVRAAADGMVVRTGQDGGYGRFVEVEHVEGLKSFYAHLGSIEAVAGTEIKAGTVIGRMGSTGMSTGAHLHFEIRDHAERPLNPKFFLGRQFAQADDLPLTSASRIPRGVRIAYVSSIPQSKRALMEARAAGKTGVKDDAQLTSLAGGAGKVKLVDGRPRARMEMQIPSPASLPERKALIAEIAASQRAEIKAEASPATPAPTPAPAPKAATGQAVDAIQVLKVDEINAPS